MKFGIYAPNFGNTFGNPKLITKSGVVRARDLNSYIIYQFKINI